MKSIVRLAPLLALAFLFFNSTLSAEPYNVYICDPAVGAIYGLSTASPGQPPTIISANVSLNYSFFKFLSPTEAIFVPRTNRILVSYDISAEALTPIFQPDPGEIITAIDAGPGINEVTVATDIATSHFIVKGVRSAPTAQWNFTRVEHAGGAISKDLLHLGGGKYVFSISNADVILTNPPSTNTIRVESAPFPATTPRLIRGPGGLWMSYRDMQSSDVARIYDSQGSFVREALGDFAGSVLSDGIFLASEWQSSPPEFSVVTRNGIISGSDPTLSPFTKNLEFSFLDGDGKRKVGSDLSGAEAIVTLTPTRRFVSNNILGGVFDVSSGADEANLHFVFQKGSGPAFRTLLDLVVGNDGYLYVLNKDDYTRDFRILRVDPTTGNRESLAEISNISLDSWLGRDSQGRFLVAVEWEDPAAPRLSVGVIDPADNPSSLTLVSSMTYPFFPSDISFGADGSARVLYSSNGPYLLAQHSGSDVSPLLYREFSTNQIQAVSENFQWKYRGEIVVPSGTPPVESLLFYGTLTSSAIGVKFTAPNSANYTGVFAYVGVLGGFPNFDPQNPDKARFGVLKLGQLTDLAGTWEFELSFPSPYYPEPPLEFSKLAIVPRPAPNSQLIESWAESQIVLYEVRPPTLAIVDLNTSAITRIPLSAAPNSNIDLGSLALMSDFKIAPDGSSAILSDQQNARVFTINPATGEVAPFIGGRPPLLAADGVRQSVTSDLRIAIGPPVPLGETFNQTGWMLRSF